MKTIISRKNLPATILFYGIIIACHIALNAHSASSPSIMPKDEKKVEPAMQKLLQATNEKLEREIHGLQDDNERLKTDRLNIMNEIRKTKREKEDLIKKIRLLSNEGQEREKSYLAEIEELENANEEQLENDDRLLMRIDDLEKVTGEMAVLYYELAISDAKFLKLEQMLKESEMGTGVAVTNAPVTREAEGRLHYNRGVVAYKSQQIRRAMREFRLALENNPLDADAHYNLAVIYDVIIKDRERAMGHYTRYLELNPGAPDAAKVKNYIVDLYTRNEVWGYPNCQNIGESLWPGRW
jgi:tetratricopeptide (TPR) repeat protein